MAGEDTPQEPLNLAAEINTKEGTKIDISEAPASITRDIVIRKWEPPAISDIISSESKSQVIAYLKRFGYDQDSTGNEDDNFITSLKAYQENGNIPVTGKYDEATRALMSKPRCAHADPKISSSTGHQPFIFSGRRYNKTDLTYRIEQFSPDLTPAKARRAIADGFACWAAVTPLSFKEVASGEDITLRFITGSYGDGSFDGPSGTLAFGYYAGPIYFDEAEGWSQSFLAQVALHEIGHSLGLAHSTVAASAMNPFYSSIYSGLQPDDIHGIHSIYGWREPRWMMIDGAKDPWPTSSAQWTTSMLSTSNAFYKLIQNGQVWQYVGPPGGPFEGWKNIGGIASTVQIVADSNILYARTSRGTILRYSGTALSWQTIDINQDCVQLAAGNGEVYQRHFNAARNYAAIYRYRGDNTTPRWELIDDNRRTRQIEIDTRVLYQRHDNGSTWRYVGPGIKWELVSDQAAASQIAVGGNTLYYLQPNGSIWGPINALDRNSETTQIIAKGDFLYQVHKDKSIWRFSGKPIEGWEYLDGFAETEDVVVNNEGDVYQRHVDGSIWRLSV